MSAAPRRLTSVDSPPPHDDGYFESLAGSAEAPQKTEPLEYFWASDGAAVLDRGYVVKGLLMPGSLIVIYGESNTGKTYLAFGLATDVVCGRPWRDRKTQRGLVIYVAGEGVEGIRNRVAAHCERNLLDRGAPLAIVKRAANFLDGPGDVASLLETVRAAESDSGEKCSLVIVDTLSRAMAGADENTADAMTTLIGSADHIRRETGAAIVFIHHAGKDSTRGARGHSSLRAAADTEILVEGQSGTRKATVVKQRDLPSGESFAFELDVVHIGQDADGDPVTACVVRHLDADSLPAAKPDRMKGPGKNQAKAIAAIREWCRTNPGDFIAADDLTAVLKAQGLRHNRKAEVVRYLVDVEALTPSVGGHRVDRSYLLGRSGVSETSEPPKGGFGHSDGYTLRPGVSESDSSDISDGGTSP